MGYKVTKDVVDLRFLWYMQSKAWVGRASPIAFVRWHVVDKVGQFSWRSDKPLDLPVLDLVWPTRAEDWEQYED